MYLKIKFRTTGKSFKLPKSVFTFHVAGDKVTYYSEEKVNGGGLAGILEQLGVKLPQSLFMVLQSQERANKALGTSSQ